MPSQKRARGQSLRAKTKVKCCEHTTIKFHSVLLHLTFPKDSLGVMRSLPANILFVGLASFLFLNFCAVTPLPSLEKLRVGELHVRDLTPHVFGEISPVSEHTSQHGLPLQYLARLGVVAVCFCCLQQGNGLWLVGTTTTCCENFHSLV
ncbi:hypothetical protein TRVL_04327 [Trypanosoma vivax]|nr:hypothetical protein TRVL_04327 [Trypanosoma vivax]